MDWGAIIDAAHADNENHGVVVQRGKRYSQVSTRIERFRREFGAWGIDTEIVQFSAESGKPVVVRATITDETGRHVASGHAFEIVGQGNVNKTAALENAETSAIGRALAVLGLHGGEMASLNEMEGADRKSKAAPPPPSLDERAAREIAKIQTITSVSELQAYWSSLNHGQRDVADRKDVIAAKDERKADLYRGAPEGAEA